MSALSEHVVIGVVGELIEELDLAIKTHDADSRMCRSSEITSFG